MTERHPIKDVVLLQKKGIPKGVCSVCSSNEYVIETAMERALLENEPVLIEATANQVNQYGGYTGMKPSCFRDFVFSIAEKIGFPAEKVILGGDHLGPLVWKNEKSDRAMEKAEELIRQYVLAGFSKIHIDTSMRLGDDDVNTGLGVEIIAQRCAQLLKEAEAAFEDLSRDDHTAKHPVYIIGSEVPIPGGSQDKEESIQITQVDDFLSSLNAFKAAFAKLNLEHSWDRVAGIVVQPGVEFGDNTVHAYDREAAKPLSDCIKAFPGLVFEGHSTDYQKASSLKEMVEDGIAILKVGPALTFALREALYSLSCIESELLGGNGAGFVQILEDAMIKHPEQWKSHYHGDEEHIRFSRKYSYSDRCRYYLPAEEVKKSLNQLIKNLASVELPLTLISQYMPIQYNKIRNGLLKRDPESLIKDKINAVLDDYYYAIKP